jgi:hypothetical protein
MKYGPLATSSSTVISEHHETQETRVKKVSGTG